MQNGKKKIKMNQTPEEKKTGDRKKNRNGVAKS